MGGGGTVNTKASWIDGELLVQRARDGGAAEVGDLRSSNGFRVKNTIPALGATVKPLMLRPGNATALSTPGVFKPMSDMRRITASVRSSDAPSGNWAKATRYCLSWVGMKPVGLC